MLEKILWGLFTKTGSIDIYMLYRKMKIAN